MSLYLLINIESNASLLDFIACMQQELPMLHSMEFYKYQCVWRRSGILHITHCSSLQCPQGLSPCERAEWVARNFKRCQIKKLPLKTTIPFRFCGFTILFFIFITVKITETKKGDVVNLILPFILKILSAFYFNFLVNRLI